MSGVEPNITWTKEKPGSQGSTGVVQEGKVLTITNIDRSDAGAFTCTAYNGYGKLEKRIEYMNVTWVCVDWKKLWPMSNRDELSIYFLYCNVLCGQLPLLMFNWSILIQEPIVIRFQ